jgi:hypothetical protein
VLFRITVFLAQLGCIVSIVSSGSCDATDLTGLILDNTGAAVSGGSVTVARSSIDGPLRAAEAYSRVTAADGSYSIKGLGAGPFIVCASAPGRPLLDPCQWGTPAVVRLAGGAGTATTTTQLQLGAMVSIRVDDPALLLFAAAPTGQPQPFLAMGVWPAGGYFHQAVQVSSDATGHNLSLIVAPNVNLPFAVSAQNVSITDATTQSVVNANQQVNMNLAPGATLQLHYIATAIASTGSTPSTNQ